MSLEELSADVEMGEAARTFVVSDLGKCILGMAHQEITFAQEQLENVSPTDVLKITELQNQAKLGRMFEQWLIELIDKGNASLEVFRHSNQE